MIWPPLLIIDFGTTYLANTPTLRAMGDGNLLNRETERGPEPHAASVMSSVPSVSILLVKLKDNMACICPDEVLVTWRTGLGNTGAVTGVFVDDNISKLAKQTLGMDEGTLLRAMNI